MVEIALSNIEKAKSRDENAERERWVGLLIELMGAKKFHRTAQNNAPGN